MTWVDRNAYMERLWALESTRNIKVITGMRRSGKSELMKAFSALLLRRIRPPTTSTLTCWISTTSRCSSATVSAITAA